LYVYGVVANKNKASANAMQTANVCVLCVCGWRRRRNEDERRTF